MRHRGVLFQRKVCVALVEKPVVEQEVGLCQGLISIAKVECDALVDVTGLGVRVDGVVRVGNALGNRHDRREVFVAHANRASGFLGGFLVDGSDGGHRFSDVADRFDGQRVLVLRNGKDAERDR